MNYGGQAFPRNGHPDKSDLPNNGMTLRDWFAGMAIQGICCNYGDRCMVDNNNPEDWAEEAYTIANAMIAKKDKES